MHIRSRALVALAAGVLMVGACGTAAPTQAPTPAPTQAPATQTPTAPPATTGGLIVVLMPSSTNAYLAQWEKGAKEKAADLGYEIRIIENNFDQAEQDTQVQQQLASADSPVGYIWWPANQEAGLASLRALSNTGLPVVQTNQLPLADTEDYWTAYAGVDDILNGWTAADLLVKKMTDMGWPTDDIGNGIIARFPIGYSAGDARIQGFQKRLTEANIAFNILATGDAGFQETEGYNVTSQLLPANRAQGVKWLYGNNDALAIGMAEAATENSFTPGDDILVVGGTCHGDPQPVVSGELVGTAIQSAFLEGWLSVQTLHKFINTGQVQDGNNPQSTSIDPDNPPSDEGAPYKYNFMPNPELENENPQIFTGTKLWGYTAEELCDY
jgi:ribose transport system substrate-binding protein